MSLLKHPFDRLPSQRRKTLWIAAGLVLLAAGATAIVTFGKSSQDGKSAAAQASAPLEFAEGDIYRVKVQPLAQSIALSGTLMPLTQATVKSTVSGEVHRVLVREGETVQQGAVVAEIDTTDARSRLEAAQADQAERRARLAIAERNRDTNQTLLKQNFISQNAFDQLNSTQQASEAAVRWSDAQVKLAQKAVDDAVVRAPIAGTVAKRFVNGGERVSPDAAMLSVVDLSRMELEATVPASDVASVAQGQSVQFSVDGFGGRKFAGRVERINPVAEAGSRAIKIFVSVPNPDGALRGGMFAEGSLSLSKASLLPALPLAAVFEEAGQSYAFTVENGKLAKRALTLGQRDDRTGLVAVASGIDEGVPVVRIRMTGLKVGAPAVVRGAQAKPSAATPG